MNRISFTNSKCDLIRQVFRVIEVDPISSSILSFEGDPMLC